MMEILYKKKVIRDFLSLYANNNWLQLVSHMLEYGIILFKQKHNISSMSPDDIYQTIEKFKKELGIYDSKVKERQFSKKGRQSTSKNKLSRSRSGSVNSNKQDMSFSGKAGTSTKVNNKKQSKRKPSMSKESIKQKSQTPNKARTEFKFINHNSNTNTKTNSNMSGNANSKVEAKGKLNKTNSNSNLNHNISLVHNHSNMRLNTTATTESNKDRDSGIKDKINKPPVMNNNSNNKKQLGSTMTMSNKSKEKQMPKERDIKEFKEHKDSHNNNTNNIQSNNSNKLIHFDTNNNNSNKDELSSTIQSKPKVKPESRIKALIENDKKKYQEQKLISQVTTEKCNTMSNNNQDVSPIMQKDTSIISLEDKLNGLTQKLSKINSSIDTYNNCFPYLNQHKDTNENNDEDYLGEDQIDLNNNNNKSEDENEIRCYRKIDSDE